MAAEIGRNWEGKPSGPRLRSGHAPLSNKEQSACDDDILQFGSPRAGRGGVEGVPRASSRQACGLCHVILLFSRRHFPSWLLFS